MEFNDSSVFVHSFRSGPSMKLSSIEINQIVALMTFLRYFFMIFYIEVCHYRWQRGSYCHVIFILIQVWRILTLSSYLSRCCYGLKRVTSLSLTPLLELGDSRGESIHVALITNWSDDINCKISVLF